MSASASVPLTSCWQRARATRISVSENRCRCWHAIRTAAALHFVPPQKLRWERAHKRGEKSDDQEDFDYFQKLELAPTEVHIPEIGAQADIIPIK
jgi:hypothetical protein